MEFSKRNVHHAFYYNIRMSALHPKRSFNKSLYKNLEDTNGKILLHILKYVSELP